MHVYLPTLVHVARKPNRTTNVGTNVGSTYLFPKSVISYAVWQDHFGLSHITYQIHSTCTYYPHGSTCICAALERIAHLEGNRSAYDEVLEQPILADGERTLQQFFLAGDGDGDGGRKPMAMKQRIRTMVLKGSNT